MLRNVEGLGANCLASLGQGIHARELLLQVCLLSIRQAGADLLEPGIDDRAGNLLLHHATLVEQGDNSVVSDGLVDGILVDEAAEGGQGILLLLEERGAREAEIRSEEHTSELQSLMR